MMGVLYSYHLDYHSRRGTYRAHDAWRQGKAPAVSTVGALCVGGRVSQTDMMVTPLGCRISTPEVRMWQGICTAKFCRHGASCKKSC